jgi:hypothetical protein
MVNHLWERRADFQVGKVGPTFILLPISDAAKELCNKVLPSGEVLAGEKGSLLFPPDAEINLTKISRAILDYGLTVEDMVEVS